MQLARNKNALAGARITIQVGGKTYAELLADGKYTAGRNSVFFLHSRGLIPHSVETRVVPVTYVTFDKPTHTSEIEETIRKSGLVGLNPEETLTWGLLGHRAAPQSCYFSPEKLTMGIEDSLTGKPFKKYGWLTIATAPNREIHLCMPDMCKAGASHWTGTALCKPQFPK